jgi:hypothetical protein
MGVLVKTFIASWCSPVTSVAPSTPLKYLQTNFDLQRHIVLLLPVI